MSDSAKPAFDRGAAEREAKAMFPNAALHRAAAQMAGCHPHALDYIRQAPVIVLAANAGKVGVQATASAARGASIMRMQCERGLRLREVMSFFGVPLQLRALYANVLHPKRWAAIYRLGRIPPSTLAQIIPATRTEQDTWLQAITTWSEHTLRRFGDPWFRIDWAASALRAVPRGQAGTVEPVADLAVEAAGSNPRGGAVFDPRWTFEQAQAAAERWHSALGRLNAEQMAAKGLGVAFTQAVDYAPFSNEPVVINGFEFVPLRSCEELYIEGAAMRHCVATYSGDVITGRSRIFSVRKDDQRVATCEISRSIVLGWLDHVTGVPRPPKTGAWKVVQVKGPCNTAPSFWVVDACGKLLDLADLRVGLSMRLTFSKLNLGATGTAP